MKFTRVVIATVAILWCMSDGFAQMFIRAVEIPCTVTDSSGKFVTDLTEKDFTVRDHGKRQKVTAVKQKIQAPLSISLLLDRSASVAASFPLLQSASEKFLTAVVRKSKDRSCLVAFDSHVYLLQDWTDDAQLLTAMIGKLNAGGGTSLFDAIYKVCRDKFLSQDNGSTKVIVLVTDGEDTDSHATFKQVADMVSQAGVIIYILGTHSENSLNPRELKGGHVLGELKDMTGGDLLYPKEGENIQSLFTRIEIDLRNQYVVTFTSYDEPDGLFHDLKLETNRKGLVVHTHKKGYFASS
ncbi:MAG: hypothetical protein C5B54_04530 [Acidobacteria bacterium]|nr:MAG: hypothetical protein C5B54_04530 [Acidobacteriota bacterium]